MKSEAVKSDAKDMGRARQPCRCVRAFSLVELVIVVAVLGILGAVVAGRFGQTADQARDTAHKIDVNSIKAAIARYQADHGGASPSYNTLASQLTNPTNFAGQIGSTKNDEYRYGPYLPKMPDVVIRQAPQYGGATLATATSEGEPIWYYRESSGRLYTSDEYAEIYATASLGNLGSLVD